MWVVVRSRVKRSSESNVGMCFVQEIRRKQLEVMLNALLRRYVEGDVEGFRVSPASLHTGGLHVCCQCMRWHLQRSLSVRMVSVPVICPNGLALAEPQKCLSVTDGCMLKGSLVLSSGCGLSASCQSAGRVQEQSGLTYDIGFCKMLCHMGVLPLRAVKMQLHGGMLIEYVLTCRKL